MEKNNANILKSINLNPEMIIVLPFIASVQTHTGNSGAVKGKISLKVNNF